MNRNEVYVAAVSVMPGFFMGINFAFSTELISQLDANITKLDIEEISWIGASSFLLAFPGSFFSSFLVDSYGRKLTLYLVYLLTFFGWIILAFSSYLIPGRIVLGFATGIGYTSMVYLAEICHPKRRAKVTIFTVVAEMCGSLSINFMDYFLEWRTTSKLLALLSLCLFFCVSKIPESPYWYVLKDRMEDAENSLKYLRGPFCSDLQELEDMKEQCKPVSDKFQNFLWTIRQGSMIKLLLILFLFVFLLELSGFDMIIPYSAQFFSMFNETGIGNEVLSIMLSCTCLVGSLLSVLVVERANRTSVVKMANLTMAVFVALAALNESFRTTPGNSIYTIACILISSLFLTLANFGLPWTIMAEVLPNEIRGIVFSLLSTQFFLLLFVLNKLFPFAIVSLSVSSILWIFAFVIFLCYLLVHLALPETRGLSLAKHYYEIII